MGQCTATGLSARLDLGAGRLLLTWTAPAGHKTVCRLGDDDPTLTLLDANGAETARASNLVQPAVVNPPERRQRYVDQRNALQTTFSWASSCGAAPTRAQLSGLTADALPVAVAGAMPPCRGENEQPVLGLLGGSAIVPADRSGLRVSLEVPSGLSAGAAVTFVGRIENPTSAAISLRPCPTYLLEQRATYADEYGPRGTSGGDTRRVPCDALPDTVPPGAALRFDVPGRIDVSPDLRGRHPADLRFGISGAEAWAATVDVDYGPA
jgi:hypothetical protein